MSSQEYAEMIEIPVSTTQVVTIAAKEPEKQQKRPSPFAFLRGRSKPQPKEKTFASIKRIYAFYSLQNPLWRRGSNVCSPVLKPI